jgi:N-acetylglucosamine-6-sulfatase
MPGGVTPGPPSRRIVGAALAAAVAVTVAASWPAPTAPPDPRPNVIVVLTDDQRWDSLDAMPWLRGELAREGSGWATFPLMFANTPLCCPSRASLLTGSYAHHTGVVDNGSGDRLDESETLASWLRAAGYRTGLVGKYLNRYPFGRLPYVPPGWDRFVGKRNQSGATVYRDFHAIDQGSPVFVRPYATDWLADRAVGFVRTAPPSRPFFLLFTPSAPHPPWIPAERHVGAYADLSVEEPPNVVGALRGVPPWVGARPVPSAAQRTEWLDDQRRADETLLAVDEALRRLVDALGPRLDRTVIFVLSDNGYSFGEHRWEGKRCPYEACVRVPLAVHSPSTIEPSAAPLSIVDLAPTILDLAGTYAPVAVDGASFASSVDGDLDDVDDPVVATGAVFLEWAGDAQIPPWTAVRTADLKLIRYGDGVEELYDLAGSRSPPDPWEMTNRIRDPRYRVEAARLRALLGRWEGAG